MGLFHRKKKYEDTSPSGEDGAAQHHGRESAYPEAEQAQSKETLSRDGALGSRMATGYGIPLKAKNLSDDASRPVHEIRTSADPEDDNAQETMIRSEREAEERDH
jgi:hypothetical protein